MAKWGMVIDLEKCTGCQACTAACQMENNRQPGESWQDVLFYEEGEHPSGQLSWLPRPCMHCENPSCMHACPTKATYKTEDGIVLIDWDRCIGCKYCMLACPYGVRFFSDERPRIEPDMKKAYPSSDDKAWNPPFQMPQERQDPKRGVGINPRSVVTKCTFCYHRVSQAPKGTPDLSGSDPNTREFTPACVVTCAPTARYFGDLDNPNSQVSRLIADKVGVRLLDQMGNRPQVYYLTGHGGAIPNTRYKRDKKV